MMKLLTNKEEPKIQEDEFEVWDSGKQLLMGGSFKFQNDKKRDISINFVFDNDIPKEKIHKTIDLIYDRYGKNKCKKM